VGVAMRDGKRDGGVMECGTGLPFVVGEATHEESSLKALR